MMSSEVSIGSGGSGEDHFQYRRGGEVELGRGRGNGRGGQHMVDYVDSNAVDFEPLTKSMGGAATTDLNTHAHDPHHHNNNHHHHHHQYKYSQSGQSTNNRNSSSPQQQKYLYHMPYVPEEGDEDMDENGSDYRQSKKYYKSDCFNDSICCYIPRKIKFISHLISKTYSLTLSELSLVSSLSICMTFFAIILLSCFISSSFDGNNNSIGSNSNGYLSPKGGKYVKGKVFSYQGVGLAPPVGTRSPPAMKDVFANVHDQPMELMDTAIFWHVPRSAGTTMKNVITNCLGKVIASEVGGTGGHNLDERLELIKKPHGLFLNVDTTTIAGLKHAKDLGTVQSTMASVIFTSYVHEAAVIFDRNHRGRFFTLLRDPVDRVVSLYYYRRLDNEKIKDMSLEDFVRTSGENWMVRMLSGYMSGPLEALHLNAAKEVLRSKFLIGLIEEKTESFRRFEEFFGWKFPSPVSQTCKNNNYYFEWLSGNPHPSLKEGDPVGELIRKINKWDVALYEYAKQLFEEQEVMFWKDKDSTPLTWKTKDKNNIARDTAPSS